jgi:Mrp family chromosome partitioning ATPase
MKSSPTDLSHAIGKDSTFSTQPSGSAISSIPAFGPAVPSVAPPRSSTPDASLNTSAKDGFVLVSDPDGEAAHRYREMVTAMMRGPWPKKRIMVTSSASGEGKTLTAVNLALVLAEMGRSVFLAELNLKRPRYRYVFGTPPEARGTESVLQGDATPDEVTFQLGATRVAVASVASPMANNDLLRNRGKLETLLEYGAKTCEWTILDVPPIYECSAIKELASCAGPVVMVARARQTKLEMFRKAAVALGNDLDYVILNDVA